MLSLPQLRDLYQDAPPQHLSAFAAQAPALFHWAGLNAGRQRCHFFLAQLGHESDGLRAREESLSYSAARLMQVWPSRFPSLAEAEPFSRDPEKLAERVYGGRMGNDRPGDGHRFRGRGYIQLTGRDAYRQVGQRAGLDLEERPELAAAPEHALAIACAYWRWKGLNALCDTGDFTGLTRRINGGLTGLRERLGWLERARHCVPWKDAEPRPLTATEIKAAHAALRRHGLYAGPVDGITGRLTLAAVAALRAEAGLPAGGLDHAALAVLGLQAEPPPAFSPDGARIPAQATS